MRCRLATCCLSVCQIFFKNCIFTASVLYNSKRRQIILFVNLKLSIDHIPKIRPATVKLYRRLGLETIEDLIYHLPRTYQDFSRITPIGAVQPGKMAVCAQVKSVFGKSLSRRGLHLTSVSVADETGNMKMIWFNQPYRVSSLKRGEWYYFYGEYGLRYGQLQMVNPSAHLVNDDQGPNLLQPIYRLTSGLKNTQVVRDLRKIKSVFSEVKEPLPSWATTQADLETLSESLKKAHFSESLHEAHSARRNLYLRTWIAIAIGSRLLQQKLARQVAQPIPVDKKVMQIAVKNLPFDLTSQQRSILWQLLLEMDAGKQPLNRLIQGDVGSGKTVIAMLLSCNIVRQGYQVALLAPTQILARQHYESCRQLLGGFLKESEVAVLSSDLPMRTQKELKRKIEDGSIKLVIGTHSLLSESIIFHKLALAIIDEQHRFGVEQRLKLLQKTEPQFSNVLSLSATPIPRSLALVVYADLKISSLTERPPGRLPVKTKVINLSERASGFKEILGGRSAHNQIYVICPSIGREEGDDSVERTKEYFLKLEPSLKYEILHSRIEAEKRQNIIGDFGQGKIEVLFCTSIIGAGIDLPNANTAIIISPEQFGLAQLHQMRGRVGRRERQGYCYLCPFSDQPPSPRLKALMKYDDGFQLSELDLQLRGYGILYGLRQSGSPVITADSIPEIYDDKKTQVMTLDLARGVAQEFIRRGVDLKQHPDLSKQVAKYQQVTHLN